MKLPFHVRRSLLFVPAIRPDRYPKALATGADAICIDLEDGVSFSDKDEARQSALKFFTNRPKVRAEVSLRINDPKTDIGQLDLDAILQSGIQPDALVLPKCEGPDDIRAVADALYETAPNLPLIVIAETARGVATVDAMATATPNVTALFFGAIDYAADVGCAVEWDAILFARSRIVLAASMAGASPIDSPFMEVPALDMLRDECQRTQALGFLGKAAIHPTQVATIQQAFTPSPHDVEWARKIIEAYERNKGGALLVDGKLIERPVIASAKRTLAMASTIENVTEPGG
jgi:citrate lyase beta subunit